LGKTIALRFEIVRFLKKTSALRFENVKFQTNFAQPCWTPYNSKTRKRGRVLPIHSFVILLIHNVFGILSKTELFSNKNKLATLARLPFFSELTLAT
jgi:hypothetical protein